MEFSNDSNSTTLPNDVRAYDSFSHVWWQAGDAVQFSCCLLGILSSILTLATVCRNKDFSEPFFICYQGIAVADLCYAFFSIFDFCYHMHKIDLAKSYPWTWYRHVG